jgi:hypothetical protein
MLFLTSSCSVGLISSSKLTFKTATFLFKRSFASKKSMELMLIEIEQLGKLKTSENQPLLT